MVNKKRGGEGIVLERGNGSKTRQKTKSGERPVYTQAGPSYSLKMGTSKWGYKLTTSFEMKIGL